MTPDPAVPPRCGHLMHYRFESSILSESSEEHAMRNGGPVAALLLSLAIPSAANSQDLVQWVDSDERRITVVGATDEQRQVRFRNGWETADYAAFAWNEIQG